jgi:hypothetical protein
MWLFFVVSLSFVFVYMIMHLFSEYYSYSVLNNIEILRDVPKTPFPSVTICDYNNFHTPEGKAYTKDVLKNFDSKLFESTHKSKTKLIHLKEKYVKSSLLKNLTIFNDFELRKKFSPTLDQILIECHFGSRSCNISDFEYFFDINYGNCYIFNSGFNSLNQKVALKSVLTSGDKSGLQLSLYQGPEDEINDLVYSTGVHMEIQNQSFRALSPNTGFNVPTGALTAIGKCFFIINKYIKLTLKF